MPYLVNVCVYVSVCVRVCMHACVHACNTSPGYTCMYKLNSDCMLKKCIHTKPNSHFITSKPVAVFTSKEKEVSIEMFSGGIEIPTVSWAISSLSEIFTAVLTKPTVIAAK